MSRKQDHQDRCGLENERREVVKYATNFSLQLRKISVDPSRSSAYLYRMPRHRLTEVTTI